MSHIFFVWVHLLCSKGWRALGTRQGRATQVMCCGAVCGGGNSAACSTLGQLSVTSPTTHKQIGPFCYLFPCGWVCVHSRTLWVSPMNFSVRLGDSPAATSPTDFYRQRFWGFIFPMLEPWVVWSVSLPSCSLGLSACKCGTSGSSSCCPP